MYAYVEHDTKSM